VIDDGLVEGLLEAACRQFDLFAVRRKREGEEKEEEEEEEEQEEGEGEE